MKKQDIKTEKDLDSAIDKLDIEIAERERKQLRNRIGISILSLVVLVIWGIVTARQALMGTFDISFTAVFLTILFCIGLYETTRDIRRYRAGVFERDVIHEGRQGIAIALIAGAIFNLYMLLEIFRHPDEMFFKPRPIEGGIEFPSIFIALPLLVGFNLLVLYIIRSHRSKMALARTKSQPRTFV
ncbi:MAG TPA: hypothetical protein VK983_05300 [Candidatus Limnocylindrales bacterium]|nr:hypothetical protein [Candidatus Limnocylindrales bacterium]